MEATNEPEMDILRVIAEDKSLVSYRPALNKITGSPMSTIVLQQCLYWWEIKGRSPFYKFRARCRHKSYRKGDSWCEELGMTGTQFDTALKAIAFKRGKSENSIAQEDALIVYFTDNKRLTWYAINETILSKQLKSLYLVIQETSITKKSKEAELLSSETNPQITPETSNSIISSLPSVEKIADSEKSALSLTEKTKVEIVEEKVLEPVESG